VRIGGLGEGERGRVEARTGKQQNKRYRRGLRTWKWEVMSGKRGENAGSPSGGTGAGKVGRPKAVGKQSKIVTEGKMGEKRVTFRMEGEKSEEEEQVWKTEIWEEVKEEIKKGLKEIEERFEKRLEEVKGKVRAVSEQIEKVKNRDKVWEKRWEDLEERERKLEDTLVEKVMARWDEREREIEDSRSEESGEKRSGSEREEERYRDSSRTRSTDTNWSEDRLSNREVGRIRRWVNEREREERRSNIIIRGIKMPEEVEGEGKKRQEWVKELIKSKVGVECEVGEVRRSGPVIVVKIIEKRGKGRSWEENIS